MSEKPIDIAKLKEAKPVTGRRFLKIQPQKGNTSFAYRLKFLGEPYERTSKKWTDPKTNLPKIETHAEVLVLATVNDKEIKSGQEFRISISANLLRQLEPHKPLKDKIFDVMNRGKPKGKTYYDYVALIQQGTLAWSTLERLLTTPTEE